MLRAPKLNGQPVLEQAPSPSATYDIANRHSKYSDMESQGYISTRATLPDST
jgi:hypothetical protein